MHLRKNREMGCLFLEQTFKGVRDLKNGFTLIELLVVLTVLLILSSFGMYLYHRSLAYAKDTVCQTNLRALQESIMFYSAENDALPGTLGEIKFDHLEKGYAKAVEGRRWLIKACSFLIKFDASDHAYAAFLTYENLKNYGATEKIFHCPGDHNGGASYGINNEIEGKKWNEIGEHVILVADCDSYVFHSLDQLSKRHDHKAFAAVKSGEVVELEEDKEVAAIEEEKEAEEADDDRVSFPTSLGETVKHFDDLVNNNLDKPIADKAEDVRNKLLTSLSELSKSPPDIPAAKGNIVRAKGDLQAMIDDGLIDPEHGLALMNLLSDLSSQL